MERFDLAPLIKEQSISEIVLDLPCDETERVFFNGYQTWSPSHEEKPSSVFRAIHPVLRALGRPWGTSRYDDSFFYKPSYGKPGIFHGFSYFYKRYEEDYLLIASTDETNGYTVFSYDFGKSELSINKDAGTPEYDQALHIAAFRGSYDEVFDAWFEEAGIKRRPAEPLAGYGSWYNRFTEITDETITADLNGCSKVLEPGDLFQIDDGWQAAVGDWISHPVKFPRGMKASVDDIHARGFKAGLWLAPFGAQADSKIIKDHPEWLLMHDGRPWYAGCNWGGFYALDMDVPEVRDHLEAVFDRIFNEWGFDLVKLDFLYAAAPWMTDGGPFAGESRGGRMCRAMDYLRKWCGDGMILGCGVPLMPAFGKVEYCRIGPDASLEWDGTFITRNASLGYPSTKNAILDAFYRRGLDGRAFLNDPDVFFLRRDNIKLTEEQKDVHARVLAQYGSFFLTSDNMGDYDEEQTAHYKELRKVWKDKSFTDKKFLKGLKD